jgi:hypothetical protein
MGRRSRTLTPHDVLEFSETNLSISFCVRLLDQLINVSECTAAISRKRRNMSDAAWVAARDNVHVPSLVLYIGAFPPPRHKVTLSHLIKGKSAGVATLSGTGSS